MFLKTANYIFPGLINTSGISFFINISIDAIIKKKSLLLLTLLTLKKYYE